MSDVIVRAVTTPNEFRALQQVQKAAWGIVDDSILIPVASMVAAQHFGGLVLGAFTAEGEAVGMSFAFLARHRGQIALYSQLMGIAPEYQSTGIGLRMKHVQRDFCREQGIATILWTFDPFQHGNARFNLNRLGARCGEYVVDMYGPRADAINAGMPTDRLVAEWEVEDDSLVRPRIESAVSELPRALSVDEYGLPRLERIESDAALLEVPGSIASMSRDDPSSVNAWRIAIRASFAELFARGYSATAFIAEPSSNADPRGFYLMERLKV